MTIDEFSLTLAESYLETVAANHPEFAGEPDAYIPFELACGQHVPEHVDRMVSEMLSIETRWERRLRSSGEAVEPAYHYRFVVQSHDDGHIVCAEGPTIPYPDSVAIGVVSDIPSVAALVAACVERPACDAVRILCFMVRVLCKTVGSGGEFVRGYGKAVGRFRMVVCLLREFVRIAREDKTRDAEREADDPEDDADDVRCIHDADSTER